MQGLYKGEHSREDDKFQNRLFERSESRFFRYRNDAVKDDEIFPGKFAIMVTSRSEHFSPEDPVVKDKELAQRNRAAVERFNQLRGRRRWYLNHTNTTDTDNRFPRR